jgi:hypothetical protein
VHARIGFMLSVRSSRLVSRTSTSPHIKVAGLGVPQFCECMSWRCCIPAALRGALILTGRKKEVRILGDF